MKDLKRILLLGGLLGVSFVAGSLFSRSVSGSPAAFGRRIRFYRDPMHPSYTSDKPGVAPDCGMPLEPVYADSAQQRSDNPVPKIHLSLEKQKLIGVFLGRVETRPITGTVHATGRVVLDETRVFPVFAGADGIVRKVSAPVSGSRVEKGDSLAAVYGRELLTAQRTFLYALRAVETGAHSPSGDVQDQPAFGAEEARLNLLDLGMGEAQIDQIIRERKPSLNILLEAPASGILLARNAFSGMHVTRGTELFRIANLERIWIAVDLSTADAAYVTANSVAQVSPLGTKSKPLRAIVSHAQPRFNTDARTVQVRLETDNPELALLPDMIVDVAFTVTLSGLTTVPAEAVVDFGERKTVFVADGTGSFAPRTVETGMRFAGRVQILAGLEPHESIAVSSNFLLDSESRLRSTSGDK